RRRRGLRPRGPDGRRPPAPPRPHPPRPPRRSGGQPESFEGDPPMSATTSPVSQASPAPQATPVPAASPTPPAGTEMLPVEHQRLAAEVRDFADEVVAPASYEYDTARRLPMEIIAQMGQLGLFGLPIPREYDGQGRDYLSLCVAV